MKARDFMRYLQERTRTEQPAYLAEHDPAVEIYDGTVRIFDQRGESCSLRTPLPRQLRALAFQLQLCAEELERRSFDRPDEPIACPRCKLRYAVGCDSWVAMDRGDRVCIACAVNEVHL